MEHQRPGGFAQNTKLSEWKWEMINMDFITVFPSSCKQHDSIWVIIDRMKKSSHFLFVKDNHLTEYYAKLYIKEVVRLNWVLFQLFQIEMHNLLHSSGNIFINVWVEMWNIFINVWGRMFSMGRYCNIPQLEIVNIKLRN